MTKEQFVEWSKTPSFAQAIDALRFLARRSGRRRRSGGNESIHLVNMQTLSRAANSVVLAARNYTGTATRRYGTVRNVSQSDFAVVRAGWLKAMREHSWNWCYKCMQLVDVYGLSDGSEVKCWGCRRRFAVTYSEGGKWALLPLPPKYQGEAKRRQRLQKARRT
jgi:hypothetical protein